MNALQRLLMGLGVEPRSGVLGIMNGLPGASPSAGMDGTPGAPSCGARANTVSPEGGITPRPPQPGLFLDLDGTLIEPMSDHADPARLRFMPGAAQALARLGQAGLKLVIVTNQSGIARGYFSRAQFAQLQTALLRRLREDAGVEIDDVAVCPHGPDAQGRPACLCRKPAPGMLVRTALARGIDLTHSFMVGDTLDDVEAGHRAGARAFLLDSGGETVWRRSPLREPDAVFSEWPALADHLIEQLSAGRSRTGAMATATDVGMSLSSSSDRTDDPADDRLDAQAPAPV